MGHSEKKNKNYDDDVYWSKNNGQSVRFRKRLQEEREAREQYEDGLKELNEDRTTER